jgi:hypothetical protein
VSGGCREGHTIDLCPSDRHSRWFSFKQRHDLEARAATAAGTLHEIYVLTPNQSLRIVYANSWTGNVCMEYVFDDARQQSLIRYAVFEKNSKFVNYDLGQEDIEDRCSMVGTDLTNIAEKELSFLTSFVNPAQPLRRSPRQ